ARLVARALLCPATSANNSNASVAVGPACGLVVRIQIQCRNISTAGRLHTFLQVRRYSSRGARKSEIRPKLRGGEQCSPRARKRRGLPRRQYSRSSRGYVRRDLQRDTVLRGMERPVL